MGYVVSMETKSPPALEDHLGYWLRLVSNHVSAAFARKLAVKDITVAEWAMLRALLDLDQPPSELASRMGMTRGAITKLADRLEERRLLRRAPSATDGRGQIVTLTAQGRALVPRLAALADANDAEFFAGLPQADRARLMKMLRAIAAGHGIERHIPTA